MCSTTRSGSYSRYALTGENFILRNLAKVAGWPVSSGVSAAGMMAAGRGTLAPSVTGAPQAIHTGAGAA